MPNVTNAKRALKKSKRNNIWNRRRKNAVKSAKKSLLAAIREKKPEGELMELYQSVTSALDRAALRRAVHPNTASRNKSRLLKSIRKVHASS